MSIPFNRSTTEGVALDNCPGRMRGLMSIQFISSDPRQRAQPFLDHVLSFGSDQIAIACAFMTGGGVELLRPHAARLRATDSFIVVAWAEPTSLAALDELYSLIPGHLFLHLGSLTPKEKGVGHGLMHSKVFLSRAGREYKLWTGSHNLTASAVEGANCEAAILADGQVEEQIYADAMAHLLQCRNEAIPYHPDNPPPDLNPEPTLVIHAERHVALRAGPLHIHLRPDTTDYDRAMRPPASVWLYLYPPGSLIMGVRRPRAEAAYSGTLTALNFTEHHPERGIPADWPADYIVQVERGIPRLTAPVPRGTTPSQGVFHIVQAEDPSTVWMTKNPVAKTQPVVGRTRQTELDPRFQKFFTKGSVGEHGELVHREYTRLEKTIKVSRKEIGDVDEGARRLQGDAELPTFISYREDLKTDDRFAFIYRAKYRR